MFSSVDVLLAFGWQGLVLCAPTKVPAPSFLDAERVAESCGPLWGVSLEPLNSHVVVGLP